MIYIGLKEFAKAMDALQMAFTITTTSLSAIQVESYKKYILVCLILHGELISLPSKITSRAVRELERGIGCAAYLELSRAYKRGREMLLGTIEEHNEIFSKDNNLGLVLQLSPAMVRRKIQRLTATYVTLSLADIGNRANLSTQQEAEQHVLNMIADGVIDAKINQRDGMLSFLESPEEYNTVAMIASLDAKVREMIGVNEKMKEVRKNTLLDTKYIQITMPREKEKGGSSRGGSAAVGDRDLAAALAASMRAQ